MANSLSNSDSGKHLHEGPRITRRRVITSAAVGAVLFPGIFAFIRPPWKAKSRRVSINGPFARYGVFSPEDVGIDKPELGFKPLLFIAETHEGEDRLFVVFTFDGKEDPRKHLRVQCVAVSQIGVRLGEKESTFGDPRIGAAKPDRSYGTIKPLYKTQEAAICLRLPKGSLTRGMHRLDIVLMEGEV